MSGEVRAALLPPEIAVPRIKAGYVQVLASGCAKRGALVAGLLTMSESPPGPVIYVGLDGVYVPAGPSRNSSQNSGQQLWERAR